MGEMDGGCGEVFEPPTSPGEAGEKILPGKKKTGSASLQEQTVLLDDCNSVSWGELGCSTQTSSIFWRI